MNTTSNTMSSGQKIIQLCKRYFFLKKKMIMIGLAALVGMIILFKLWSMLIGSNSVIEGAMFFTFGLVLIKYTGYALTSTMFNEINSKGTAPFFFTLPASTFEKLASAWLISFVGYTAVALVLIVAHRWSLGVDLQEALNKNLSSHIWTYIIAHSVYLYGAVLFKRNNFLNTLVAIIVSTLAFALIVLIVRNYIFSINDEFIYFSRLFLLSPWISVVLTIVIATFFYWLTYRKLQKRQVG